MRIGFLPLKPQCKLIRLQLSSIKKKVRWNFFQPDLLVEG